MVNKRTEKPVVVLLSLLAAAGMFLSATSATSPEFTVVLWVTSFSLLVVALIIVRRATR